MMKEENLAIPWPCRPDLNLPPILQVETSWRLHGRLLLELRAARPDGHERAPGCRSWCLHFAICPAPGDIVTGFQQTGGRISTKLATARGRFGRFHTARVTSDHRGCPARSLLMTE